MFEITLQYWFLFPISIAIATIAMSSGVGGAVFFSPIFLLWLKLEPSIAVGTALLTELFGFGSGMVAYVRSKRIDYKLAGSMLMFSIPAAVVGVLIADKFAPAVLKGIFATGLLFLGYELFSSWRRGETEAADKEVANTPLPGASKITDKDGNVFVYTVCNKAMGRLFAAIGGLFLGMISVGLAELEEYHLVARCKVPSAVAIATSIFVVVCTVLVAVIGHGHSFISEASQEDIAQVINIVIYTVPGVLIGGQLGPAVGARVNPDLMKVAVSMIFMGVGAFMLALLAF